MPTTMPRRPRLPSRARPPALAAALCLAAGSALAQTGAAAPDASTAPTALPVVVVTGQALDDPLRARSTGLLPQSASAALQRLAPSIREQAQTLQVVPLESIIDRGALSLHEAIDTLAGVRPVSPAYASRTGGIRSRGFETQDSYLNGVRFSGFGVPVDSANVESVEILKGPAGVQFGLAEPGGALNIVTKRPLAQRQANARLTLGRFDTRRLDVDLGGALSHRDLLTRFNASVEANEEHRDFDRNRRLSVAPAFTWLASERTTVDVELGVLRNEYRFNRGLPPRAFILALPEDFSTGEPNQPLSRNHVLNAFYTLQHSLGDGRWQLRQRAGAHRTRSTSSEINSGVSDVDADGRLSRNYYTSYQRENSWVLQHELVGQFEAAGIQQRALVGFEVGDSGREYGFREVIDPQRNPPPLLVAAPIYGGYGFPTDAELRDSYPPETYGNRYRALYADWHATLSPQWRLQLGLRLDRTKGYYRPADGGADYAAADSRGASPRAGLVWTPRADTDVFANISTGFSPNLFADSAGTLFDTPEKSRQIEAGLRHELVPQRLRLTASAYRIAKRNVQTPDPADPTGNRSILAGEQRSDGAELELAGALTPHWDLTASYAYTDARTHRHSDSAQVGLPLVDAPRHHAALWTKHRLAGAAPGWWLGYGLVHVGERRSSNANAAFKLPAYTRHDLALGYAAGRWSAQANLGNVGDERVYYTHGNNIHLQPGRNLRVSMDYRF